MRIRAENNFYRDFKDIWVVLCDKTVVHNISIKDVLKFLDLRVLSQFLGRLRTISMAVVDHYYELVLSPLLVHLALALTWICRNHQSFTKNALYLLNFLPNPTSKLPKKNHLLWPSFCGILFLITFFAFQI